VQVELRRFPQTVILGPSFQTGCYVLSIEVFSPIEVKIGKLNQGKTVLFKPGNYLYVGSAMGKPERFPLYRRVLRHCKRSGNNPPQSILPFLQESMIRSGLGNPGIKFGNKTLFWNIDYLLNHPNCQLNNVLILRSDRSLEIAVATLIHEDPESGIPMVGFGANDSALKSHLFHVPHENEWWLNTEKAISNLAETS
jgi:Uri superfamily endonuclease